MRYTMTAPASSLPEFTATGVLPAGEFALTLAELRTSILVHGPGHDAHPAWDAEWRAFLVDNLAIMARQLWAVGIDDIFVDGSFAEDKAHPGDIDGHFVCDAQRFATGVLEQELNRLDPAKCWTWDHRARRRYRGYPKLQLPMWHAYRVELYPHFSGAIAGVDEHGQPLEFPAFFRKARGSGEAKGIVRLIKEHTRGGQS